METKICNCCKIEKTIDKYSNNKRFEDNKNVICKDCDKKRSLKYYYNNIDKVKDATKVRRSTEEYKLTRQKYLEDNHEEINKVRKLYKLDNREKVLQEKKDYYKRKMKDPLFVLTRRLRNGIYRSLRSKKIKCSLDILGCTQEEFKFHIESQFTEGMNWNKLSEIHIDHIIPISSAKSIEELYKLNYYTNLQPLWAKDNLSKYNKIT